jgi:hypothetical protein
VRDIFFEKHTRTRVEYEDDLPLHDRRPATGGRDT